MKNIKNFFDIQNSEKSFDIENLEKRFSDILYVITIIIYLLVIVIAYIMAFNKFNVYC